MYKEFYGFDKTPFHIVPDIDFLFMSPKHKEALACMEFGLLRDVGLMLITGEIGIGKTTLIQHLLSHIEGQIKIACIANTNVSADQLLLLILQAFGGAVQSDHKAITIQALEQLLHQLHARNQRPLLIVDDAQNLAFEALEEIRLLSNLQKNTRALVQIILVGQPELKARLVAPQLASFVQRIGVSYHLRPFTEPETRAYIVHRLRKVGGRPDIFSPGAMDLIYRVTGGIPRAVNHLCDNALVYGFVDELKTIDAKTIQQVTEEVGLYFAAPPAAGGTSDGAAEPPAAQPHAGTMQSAQALEARIASLERVLGEYARELHNLLKAQLINDRRRADKLLTENAALRAHLEAVQGSSAGSANPPEHKKSPVRSLKSQNA